MFFSVTDCVTERIVWVNSKLVTRIMDHRSYFGSGACILFVDSGSTVTRETPEEIFRNNPGLREGIKQ